MRHTTLQLRQVLPKSSVSMQHYQCHTDYSIIQTEAFSANTQEHCWIYAMGDNIHGAILLGNVHSIPVTTPQQIPQECANLTTGVPSEVEWPQLANVWKSHQEVGEKNPCSSKFDRTSSTHLSLIYTTSIDLVYQTSMAHLSKIDWKSTKVMSGIYRA